MTGLAAAGLAIAVAASGRHNRLTLATIAALTLSAAGDTTGAFLPKLALFAAAHIAYIIGFWPYRHNRARDYFWPIYSLAFAGGLTVAAGTNWATGLAILTYVLLITTMTALAARLSVLAGIGAVVFMASDMLVGWAAFHHHPAAVDWAAVGLYVIAQALLAAAIIRTNRQPQEVHP